MPLLFFYPLIVWAGFFTAAQDAAQNSALSPVKIKVRDDLRDQRKQ